MLKEFHFKADFTFMTDNKDKAFMYLVAHLVDMWTGDEPILDAEMELKEVE